MLIFYLLCYAQLPSYYAQYYAQEQELMNLSITSFIQICINKSLFYSRQCRKTVLLGCGYKNNDREIHCMFLDIDCSIRVYQSFAAIFQNYLLLCVGIMLNAFSDLKLCWRRHNRLVPRCHVKQLNFEISQQVKSKILSIIGWGKKNHWKEKQEKIKAKQTDPYLQYSALITRLNHEE